MSLSSLEFAFLLPPLIAVYWLLYARRLQHVYLALVTALFIAFNDRSNLWVLLWVLAATMTVVGAANRFEGARRWIISGGIVGLIANLAYFKYLPWLADLAGVPLPATAPPLGISYYTFILIGFLADSSRQGRLLTSWRLPQLLMFFPFLSSGPLVRLQSWSAQMSSGRKRFVMRNVTTGTHLFLIGLTKKILIADAIALSTSPIWASPTDYGRAALALATISFYVQLYADFSGYTDMARGVARMMGFHLPINFKAPYFAALPTEFWSRWHMSLTGWIRDYAFTPLSVLVWRRVSSRRLAPFVTFALSVVLMTMVGLWHGASTNFVLFGMFHGILIGAWYAAVGNGRRLSRRQRVLSWAMLQVLLIVSMTMFRADTLGRSFAVVSGIFVSHGAGSVDDAWFGLAIAIVAIYTFQRFEIRPGRRLARMRGDARLFPIYLALIVLVLYFKGLTLEGVWISPADPFFNQGQEKFIYLQF